MPKITKADVTKVFNGQSDIVVFDAPTAGYSSATTLADVTAAGISLGQVVGDSTSWEGEEASAENIVDEQGKIIVSSVTAGTYAFSCDVASTDVEKIKLFLRGAAVTVTSEPVSVTGNTNLIKAGTEIPVITRPIAIFNDEANRYILFPKARIIANLSLDDKLMRIHIVATAENIDTTELGTFMIGDGAPAYAS